MVRADNGGVAVVRAQGERNRREVRRLPDHQVGGSAVVAGVAKFVLAFVGDGLHFDGDGVGVLAGGLLALRDRAGQGGRAPQANQRRGHNNLFHCISPFPESLV